MVTDASGNVVDLEALRPADDAAEVDEVDEADEVVAAHDGAAAQDDTTA